MILAIAIAAAVTLGLYTAVSLLMSKEFAFTVRTDLPGLPTRYVNESIAVARYLMAGLCGLFVGLAVFGFAAIFVISSAHAELAPCMSASLQMAFTRGPGIQVQRITREGSNPAAIVEAFLANAGAPDLNTDDFLLSVDAEAVTVTPVRAGQVCRNFTRLAFPMASGGQALLKAIELAAMGAGRA